MCCLGASLTMLPDSMTLRCGVALRWRGIESAVPDRRALRRPRPQRRRRRQGPPGTPKRASSGSPVGAEAEPGRGFSGLGFLGGAGPVQGFLSSRVCRPCCFSGCRTYGGLGFGVARASRSPPLGGTDLATPALLPCLGAAALGGARPRRRHRLKARRAARDPARPPLYRGARPHPPQRIVVGGGAGPTILASPVGL